MLLVFVSGCTGIPDGVSPVTGFDVNRYLGTWYEIARLDHSFERGMQNVTAEYSMRDDGGVNLKKGDGLYYHVMMMMNTQNRTTEGVPPARFYSELRRYVEPLITLGKTDSLANRRRAFAKLRDSEITHSHYAALKTKDAIVDKIRDKCGDRPNVDPKNPDLRVNLHLARNHCTVSLDLAGTGLHRRGYRRDPTIAPLKETLAAGLVALTAWDKNTHFVDPMCGSGSLPLEAAMLASNAAPGLLSPSYGFQRWLNFDASLWEELLEEARRERERNVS